jgi:hypothetical protein
MKRLLAALVAVSALLAGAVVSTAPASAYIDDPMINGKKFATTAVCVAAPGTNGAYYRVAYEAQSWNNVVGTDVLGLTYKDDCAGTGYGPSKRMVVGTYNNPTTGCLYFTNQQTAMYNGYNRWTNGPGVYVNTAGTCANTQAKRDHWVGEGIGYLLGLINFGSAGWNSHIMNETDYSISNITQPSASEGQKVREIYLGVFCDSGTVC